MKMGVYPFELNCIFFVQLFECHSRRCMRNIVVVSLMNQNLRQDIFLYFNDFKISFSSPRVLALDGGWIHLELRVSARNPLSDYLYLKATLSVFIFQILVTKYDIDFLLNL